MPDILSYLRSFRHLIHLPDGDGELLQRFRLQRDEKAFATLVQRHGPMVLAIAQRILGQSDLLDDVFQATFLVLAKRGRHMETWPSVAGWLVQVARRTALQARAKSARRNRHEQRAAAMTPNSMTTEPAEVVSQRDLSRLLDAELARLPSKYRTPLVLCHLEGQTKEETAHQLGWPVGSVSGRLARGKKLLQARLLRRGIVPALATSIFTVPAANAHLSSLLIQATTLLAVNVVHQTSQVPTGTAIVLAQGVMTSMFMTKVKYAAAVVMVLVLCLGTGAWAWQGHGKQASPQVQESRNEAKAASLLEQLQGVWEVVSATEGRRDLADPKEGGKSYWIFCGQVLVGSKVPYLTEHDVKRQLKINDTVSPCQIDYEFQAPEQKFRQYWKGIVKLQDGNLTMSLVGDQRLERPKTFDAGNGVITYILRRATDYDRLEGIWRKEERNPVTDEIDTAEELIFKKNMYVRRQFSNRNYTEDRPREFVLNESVLPKQLDWDIRTLTEVQEELRNRLRFMDKRNKDVLTENEIRRNKIIERNLGIYELKENEFKFLISGAIPFTLEDDKLVSNPKSPLNKRATSFASTEGTIRSYTRVERSLKDSNNSKLETADDPRFKPPTGTPGETPATGTPSSSELLDLRQQRLKLAQERLELWKQTVAAGNPRSLMYDEWKIISQQLLDARLAVATDTDAKVRAMNEHLSVLKQIEDRTEQGYKAGSKTKDDLVAAQLRRIEFEIQLQELKEKR